MGKGDHIFVRCVGYSHHGIDVGDGTVVHFEAAPWQALTACLAGQKIPSIRRVSRGEFAAGRPVQVRVYAQADDPDRVVERALSRVGETGYCVLGNNCEHLAVWCKTGQSASTQVNDLWEATRPMTESLPVVAALMRHGRRLPGRWRLLAYGGAAVITTGSFAFRYVELRWLRATRGES